jgi:hypothetical protein
MFPSFRLSLRACLCEAELEPSYKDIPCILSVLPSIMSVAKCILSLPHLFAFWFPDLIQESDCTPCLGGYYCPMVGMVTPVDLCSAGYFCKQYANISAPSQGADANICPVGHYCIQGTANPTPCPKGTYNNSTRLESEADCPACPAGSYCAEVGKIEPTGLCAPGWVFLLFLRFHILRRSCSISLFKARGYNNNNNLLY